MHASSKPQELRLDVGSVALGALDYGNADADPVLMAHGIGDSAWSLDPLT